VSQITTTAPHANNRYLDVFSRFMTLSSPLDHDSTHNRYLATPGATSERPQRSTAAPQADSNFPDLRFWPSSVAWHPIDSTLGKGVKSLGLGSSCSTPRPGSRFVRLLRIGVRREPAAEAA
jgi:hypothetical protein